MPSDNKNKNVYVGHRYVPKIFGVWDKLKTYEGLSIVTWEGTSYTSKKRVPEGVDILNEEYWVVTGNYNAQVEQYRQDVRDMQDEVDSKVDQSEFDDSLNSVNQQLAETDYYQEYETKDHYDEISRTKYWFVKIKHKDNEGNLIKIRHSLTEKSQGESVREFSNKVGSTIAINASTMKTGVVPIEPSSALIVDGVVVQEPVGASYEYHLGIKEDNTLTYYPPYTTTQDMLNDGAVQVLRAFSPLISGNVKVDEEVLNSAPNSFDKHPRQVIAQYNNKDILIMTTGGRGFGGEGMTAHDVIRILLLEGVRFAYMLDGGGSTQTVVRGTLINDLIDEQGTKERPRPNFLYFLKESSKGTKKDIKNSYMDIGEVSKDLQVLRNEMEFASPVGDFNLINKSGSYWGTRETLGNPFDSSCAVMHFATNGGALQVAYPYSDSGYTVRRRLGSDGITWGDWVKNSPSFRITESIDFGIVLANSFQRRTIDLPFTSLRAGTTVEARFELDGHLIPYSRISTSGSQVVITLTNTSSEDIEVREGDWVLIITDSANY